MIRSRPIPHRIVLLDPPFAYGRQMIVADENGVQSRVAYDAEIVEAVAERRRFPQAIARDSQELRDSIGPARLALADERDRARLLDTADARRIEAVVHAMLREAA